MGRAAGAPEFGAGGEGKERMKKKRGMAFGDYLAFSRTSFPYGAGKK